MKAVSIHPLYFIFSLCFINVSYSDPIYCASTCADFVDACFGPSYDECYACSTTIFNIHADNGTCLQSSQHQLKYYELSTTAMDVSGYSTNNPTLASCGDYQLSGQYTAGQYIQKTFTNLGTNHYETIIRFGIGFIGTWNLNDQMIIEIEGTSYTLNYTCSYPFDVCSGSDIDCFKIVQYIISHNSSSVSVKVSSLISETDPSIQYWGLKDMTVSVRTCHSSCLTCTGPMLSECLSCQSGYYLHGNVCVNNCNSEYTIPDLRKCSSSCPSGYYPQQSSSSKICLNCESGCVSCEDSNSCTLWSDGRTTQSLWQQHFLFWILLIIVGCLVFFILFWKCIIQRYIDKKVENEMSEDLKKSMMEGGNNSQQDKSKVNQATLSPKNDRVIPEHLIQNVTEQHIVSHTEQISSHQINPNWVQQLQDIEKIVMSKPKHKKPREKIMGMIDDIENQQATFQFQKNE